MSFVAAGALLIVSLATVYVQRQSEPAKSGLDIASGDDVGIEDTNAPPAPGSSVLPKHQPALEPAGSDTRSSEEHARLTTAHDALTSAAPSTDDKARSLAAVSGKRLTWAPEPIIDKSRTYDLCDDAEAITAGLDGGDLANDRRALGIDCNNSINRYGSFNRGGALTFSDVAPGETDATVADDARFNDPESSGDMTDAATTSESELPLGYRGPDTGSIIIPEAAAGELFVVPGSVQSIDGTTYGLVANATGNLAEDVRIESGSAVSEHPLSVQPGETAPFALDTGTGSIPAEEIGVQASLSDTVDMARAVLISGAPGFWNGPRDLVPAPAGVVNVATAPELVVYYQSTMEVATPTTAATGTVDLQSIHDLQVVASFFDEQGAVLGVIHPQPFGINENHEAVPRQVLQRGEILSIGFLMPPEAADLAIWVGGTRP